MKKIQGYDEVPALTGEYERLEPGGYICQIISAKEETSKSGKRMLVITFDIEEGESKGFYQRRYDEDIKTNPEAKWRGVYRQMLEGEKAAGFFKGLITSLEASNPSFKWDWKESKLKNLKFGGLFGREEYEKLDGTTAFATKIKFIRTVESIKNGSFEIPKDKLLPQKGEAFDNFETTSSDNDDLPF